jgi:hypothetical protein
VLDDDLGAAVQRKDNGASGGSKVMDQFGRSSLEVTQRVNVFPDVEHGYSFCISSAPNSVHPMSRLTSSSLVTFD